MFHIDDFLTYIENREHAELAARIANELVNQNGLVIYGEAFENDKGDNELTSFTTTQKKGDTHTALVLQVAQMRNFKPLSGDFRARVERPIKQKVIDAQRLENADLRRDNQELKNK
jgi:hypothetical protein